MPNTNPCPTCHAQLDPGTPHTFCARTKEPKARELEARLTDVERTLRLYADDDCEHGGRSVLARLEALERYTSNIGRFVNGGFDMAFNERRIAALERVANENTGAAPIGASADRDGVVRDSHGQDRTASEGGAPTSPRLDQPDKRPHIDGAAPCSPYKMTDDQRALLANAAAIRYTNNVSGYDSLADHVESLVTRAVRDTIQHGGGLERNATPREGRCPSPAASALPMPERPKQLDKMAAFLDVEDGYAQQYLEDARDAARYALSLESRLAESNKHRNEYAESNLRTASKLADMSEAFARERTDHAALKAKLAEAEAKVKFLVEREEHFASVLQVADGGQYRNDWDAAISRVIADRDALRAKLEASEAEVRRLEVVANEDRAVSDAIRGERERLRAKLEAAEKFWRDVAHVVGVEYAADGHATQPGPMDAVLDVVKENVASVPRLEEANDRLRAKLDGVREAAEKWDPQTLPSFPAIVAAHEDVVRFARHVGREAITSALAAAENTNTGDAGRTPAGQCSTDRSTDGQPPTSTEPAVDEPGPVTNPAVSHPSTAPAFEMTFEQRTQLYSFLGMSTLGSRRERESLAAFVTDLVRSELRKAREGWVTREVAERALEQCALEYISGSSVHANAKDYLTAAIRAASKEASDGTR